VSFSLQGMKYIQEKTLKRMVTLVKAAEKEKESSFAPWWTLWGIHGKVLPQKIVKAITGHMYLISEFGPPGLTSLLGKPKKQKEFIEMIKKFEQEEPDRALFCRKLLDELEIMLDKLGLWQVPPAVADFEEEPEEADVYLPPEPLFQPSKEPVEDEEPEIVKEE